VSGPGAQRPGIILAGWTGDRLRFVRFLRAPWPARNSPLLGLRTKRACTRSGPRAKTGSRLGDKAPGATRADRGCLRARPVGGCQLSAPASLSRPAPFGRD